MNKETFIICEREAICSAVTGQADTCEYRCEDCGNYFFRNDQNREEYEKLDSEERERILKKLIERDIPVFGDPLEVIPLLLKISNYKRSLDLS